ncbi:photosynthetic complex putative assembly protein PuhB [Palleronia abyssalis]|uniref:YdbS-like PH domain-containing protein n=1 Tax=Palleronia abyssalis TaxID=1501240 RepID=A0A2R8BWX8_9RHOB|nr:photosynthetic complex putative assembly protein PuhB [Palleronia abyssalis]SPJ24664.1 hypothetical protein PAA8504_02501 [Palleronia abyssalis]
MPRDYRNDPDFTIEEIPGLPESLPRGESVLWQGRPDAWALAVSSLSLKWIAGYFVLLAFARGASLAAEFGWLRAMGYGVPILAVGLVACAILFAIAWVQARATVYTITTERVAMRIGAALTLTVNLPFPKIASADLALGRSGTGTIALTPASETRLSYVVLWPHVRPWHMRDVKPALRCVKDAKLIAGILANAVEARSTRPELSAMAAE